MNLSDPLTRTVWDWLKIELRLHALETGGDMYSVSYDFEEGAGAEAARGACLIYAKQVQTMVSERASREKRLEYYLEWVDAERIMIEKIATDLVGEAPADLRDRFVYRIMYDYGMGARTICELRDTEIVWMEAGDGAH